MREHMGLFRGKRGCGLWAIGAYSPPVPSFGTDHTIIQTDGQIFSVDPETIGECTGLTDKNGDLIFEGDVLKFNAYGQHYKGVVSFVDGNFCIICNRPTASPFLDDAINRHDAVAICNIHDNPELLE